MVRLLVEARKRAAVVIFPSWKAPTFPGKVDEAEKLLREGRAKMRDCEEVLTDLLLDHGE
jgi:hypothetical protein